MAGSGMMPAENAAAGFPARQRPAAGKRLRSRGLLHRTCGALESPAAHLWSADGKCNGAFTDAGAQFLPAVHRRQCWRAMAAATPTMPAALESELAGQPAPSRVAAADCSCCREPLSHAPHISFISFDHRRAGEQSW
ncbi:hypothetical protein M8494_37945 [Serratia ureilytica]